MNEVSEPLFIRNNNLEYAAVTFNQSNLVKNMSDHDLVTASNFDEAVRHRLMEYTPAIIFTSVLMVIGIPGNIIVCLVYGKWRNSSSTKVFILALAFLDLLNCFVTCPSEIAMMAQSLQFDFSVVCKISRFSTYFCNTSAALILIAIAADRYRRICTPSRTKLTPGKARLVVVILVLISVCVTWPAFVLYGTKSYQFNHHHFRNIFAKNCLLEGRFANTVFPVSYFAFHCVSTIAVFTIISILYIFVGISVFQRWRFRKQFVKPTVQFHLQVINNQSREQTPDLNITRETSVNENDINSTNNRSTTTTHLFSENQVAHKSRFKVEKTAFMLFIATIVYFISFLPFLGLAIHRSVHPEDYVDMSLGSEMVFQIFFRSYLINSALDPIIYSFLNTEFRVQCLKCLHLI